MEYGRQLTHAVINTTILNEHWEWGNGKRWINESNNKKQWNKKTGVKRYNFDGEGG